MYDKQREPNASEAEAPPTAASAEHARRHPDEWVTEDGPMTEAQAAALRRLCQAAGEPFDAGLSKGDASQRIEALRKQTGRDPAPGILMDEQTDG